MYLFTIQQQCTEVVKRYKLPVIKSVSSEDVTDSLVTIVNNACTCAQSCLTLWDPMDCSLPRSSVHAISQARIQEWIAISFHRGSAWPKDRTHISCISRWILYHWATWEAHSEQYCTVFWKGLRESILPQDKKIVSMWCDGCSPVISQYIHMSNHYVVLLKLIESYMSIISQSGENILKKRIITNFKTTRTLLEGSRSTEKN